MREVPECFEWKSDVLSQQSCYKRNLVPFLAITQESEESEFEEEEKKEQRPENEIEEEVKILTD